jgi:hypothetical protein
VNVTGDKPQPPTVRDVLFDQSAIFGQQPGECLEQKS